MGQSDFLYAKPSFIDGWARLFDFGGNLNIYNESLTKEMADSIAIWMDWYITGTDIEDAVEQYRKELSKVVV